VSQFFPAWFLLVWPWKRVILCSYQHDFAAQWGGKVRDLVAAWGPTFGTTVRPTSKAADRWETAHGGGMQTAGIDGPVLGKGADLLILDDVCKNAEEALSPVWRAKAWDWLTSTAYTRLEPGASVVNIQQRWHTEDVAGQQVTKELDRWSILRLPALAEENDPLGRSPGEALWPERYSRVELERMRSLAPMWFAAQYQQRPLDLEGGFFRGLERIRVVGAAPTSEQFRQRVRFWDLAATDAMAGADPDYTCGVLMGRHTDGTFWVLDVVRVRVGPKGVRWAIRQAAELDGPSVAIRIEREGGAAGKIAADAIVTQELAGWPAAAVRPEGSKAERAEPWGSQIEAGNVCLVRAAWNAAFLDEHRAFPTGDHDDQVDAASGAFRQLTRPAPNIR
jgi:predicted phage terminase large subunit-like protein